MHIHRAPNLWTQMTCLQCVNVRCVFVGDISFEIKTEVDSNDITEYPRDDMPSTGMIVFRYESILCATFALMFMSFYNMHILCK